MNSKLHLFLIFFFYSIVVKSQSLNNVDSSVVDNYTLIHQLILKQKEDHKVDSIIKVKLNEDLVNTALSSNQKLESLQKLNHLIQKDSLIKIIEFQKIESLKKSAPFFPVILFNDTILNIYAKIGSLTPKARAEIISTRTKKLYEDDFFKVDSLKLFKNENTIDIIYNNDIIIMTINDIDALWLKADINTLAVKNLTSIKKTILKYKSQNSFKNWMFRIGQILLIVLCVGLIIFIINKLFEFSKKYLITHQDRFLNGITIKKFQLFTADKHREFALKLNNIVRVVVIILLVYLSLPLIFSVFPATKSITDVLLGWILSPAKKVLRGFLGFLPNMFTIIVIFYITKWTIKLIGLFFTQVKHQNLKLVGFHKDWAMPTFNILKFLLYAFMIVVIFPYLPGSDSAAFQGVSVFLGILLSLGSSSAITNIIAGLVITYMRPFKVGDRVKIGDVIGDVMAKTMLVTRIRTIKNEDITVPNSTVLSSHTINYSSNALDKGLIVHTTVTIGYDVPWKKMHQALLSAATRTEFLLKDPKPFVFQTSLDDFYVSYQINAYTKEANLQAEIYSQLHANIQDCCNEIDIEIMSPHYRAARDGNMTTVPENYHAKDYKAPSFNVNINTKNDLHGNPNTSNE